MSKEGLVSQDEIVKSSDEVRSAVRLIKAAILQSQVRAIQMVNQEQLSLYFGIGRYVSEHSRKGYWGTGAIGTISKQLKSELPGLKGFSEENIKLMRRFYEAWKDIETNSVVGTTEITNFNNSEQTANSVVETTDLQKADSEARLASFIDGQLDLREAYTHPESEKALYLVTACQGLLNLSTLIKTRDVTEEMLPEAGYTFP